MIDRLPIRQIESAGRHVGVEFAAGRDPSVQLPIDRHRNWEKAPQQPLDVGIPVLQHDDPLDVTGEPVNRLDGNRVGTDVEVGGLV